MLMPEAIRHLSPTRLADSTRNELHGHVQTRHENGQRSQWLLAVRRQRCYEHRYRHDYTHIHVTGYHAYENTTFVPMYATCTGSGVPTVIYDSIYLSINHQLP